VDVKLRAIFNAHYKDALYRRVCALMGERLEEPAFGFRLAEMPLLVPADLRAKLETGAREILALLCRPEMLAAGRRSRDGGSWAQVHAKDASTRTPPSPRSLNRTGMGCPDGSSGAGAPSLNSAPSTFTRGSTDQPTPRFQL